MNPLKLLINWFGRAMSESDGQPSSLRLIVTVGALAIIFSLVGVWVFASIRLGAMAEVPASVGTTLGSYLITLLTAKIWQKGKEADPAP